MKIQAFCQSEMIFFRATDQKKLCKVVLRLATDGMHFRETLELTSVALGQFEPGKTYWITIEEE